MSDQRIDFGLRQLLSKCRHVSFASRHYRSQTSGTGNGRILFPPFPISEIGSLVEMYQRRVATAIAAMTARAISIEQFDYTFRCTRCRRPPVLRIGIGYICWNKEREKQKQNGAAQDNAFRETVHS
jgi:hypothetical protein